MKEKENYQELKPGQKMIDHVRSCLRKVWEALTNFEFLVIFLRAERY